MSREWIRYKYPSTAHIKGQEAVKQFSILSSDLSTAISNSKNKMAGYADTSFRVGESKTFNEISENFISILSKKEEEIDSYLEDSTSVIQDIMNKMETDNSARNLAYEAYNKIMDDTDSYRYTDEKTGESYVNTIQQTADALAAGDAEWDANKSDAW